jgi:ATP-binding cassette subfamily B protein
MKQKIMKRFALTEKGARDMIWSVIAATISNLALMFPVGLLYYFTKDYLDESLTNEKIIFYIVGIVICLVLIYLTSYWQYNSSFFAIYIESGKRRISLAEKLRKLPLSFFGKRDLADLTTTIMADSEALEHAGSHLIPQYYGSMISTVIICVGLFFFQWKMALAAVWVIPIALLIVITSKSIQNKITMKQTKAKLSLDDGIQEFIETNRDLKSYNAEANYLKELENKIDTVEKGALTTELGIAVFVVSAQLILKLGIGTVALVGSALLKNGEISLMQFFAFLLVASRLYEPMSSTLVNIGAVNALQVNIDRMNEITNYPEQTGNSEFNPNGYDITFDHVAFSYDDGKTVLSDVSFTAKQGEVTALVGTSGGGKTTVSRLAARFWDADGGMVTVGGKDISNIDPETLLSVYSIVFQDVTLFNNTVMENIRIGKKDATDKEVLAAAKLANCDEFALKLPNGYDTVIGENGSELSGGERQRISIARAFLKDSPIILLDEASASLDVENETAIQTALSRLIKDKTVIVIAHRMRTVSGADKIVVLSDGVVKESGKPVELMQKNGLFAQMVKTQTDGQEWALG